MSAQPESHIRVGPDTHPETPAFTAVRAVATTPPRAPIDDTKSARTALKTILVMRGITYARLADLLTAQGITETETSIAQKVRRGTFLLAFMYQCMRAIGVTELVLSVPGDQPSGVVKV